MRIKLYDLLNDPTYKLFSLKGLENIIGNFLTREAYNKLIGVTSKEKAENLSHMFQRQKSEPKFKNRKEAFAIGKQDNSVLIDNKKL